MLRLSAFCFLYGFRVTPMKGCLKHLYAVFSEHLESNPIALAGNTDRTGRDSIAHFHTCRYKFMLLNPIVVFG